MLAWAILNLGVAAVFAFLWWRLRESAVRDRSRVEALRRTEADFLRRIQRRGELLHRLVDGIEDGLFIVGRDCRVLFVSVGARHFFPAVTEPVGRKLFESIPNRQIVDLVERVLATGRREAEEVPVVAAGPAGQEDRVYEAVALPLHSDEIHSGEGDLLLILRDETEKHALEKIRKDFVANASHELRTPLSIIIGYLENLTEGVLEGPEEVERAYSVMKKHGHRLGQIVEDLLVISRMESGQEDALRREEFDLRESAEDVIHRLSPVIAAQGARVRVEVGPGTVPRLLGDRFYWDQILFNLVQNALKENPARGLEVVIEMRRDDGLLQVEVRDNGVGIPQADLPYVFKRFYRVMRREGDGELKGTGLGLSIVKRAVEAHKGTIALRSVPGVETVFTIRVPHGLGAAP